MLISPSWTGKYNDFSVVLQPLRSISSKIHSVAVLPLKQGIFTQLQRYAKKLACKTFSVCWGDFLFDVILALIAWITSSWGHLLLLSVLIYIECIWPFNHSWLHSVWHISVVAKHANWAALWLIIMKYFIRAADIVLYSLLATRDHVVIGQLADIPTHGYSVVYIITCVHSSHSFLTIFAKINIQSVRTDATEFCAAHSSCVGA